MKLKNIISDFAELVFTPRCFACGDILYRSFDATGLRRCFCPVCIEGVVALETPYCSCCAEPFAEGANSHLCSMCLSHPAPFEKVASLFEFGGPLAEAICRFKYGPTPWMGRELGQLLPQFKPEGNALVVPVPLHPLRLKKRGFNQAAFLARAYSESMGKTLCTTTLYRARHLASQVGKGKTDRIADMKNVFEIRDPAKKVAGKQVILVDDVITTTATVRAASQVLIRDGNASNVVVLSLARSSMCV